MVIIELSIKKLRFNET